MEKIYKVKQITRLYESCDECGLPSINCICNQSGNVRSKAQVWILSSERELYRPSNTARILKLINPESTELFLWERTKRPDRLIEKINSEKYAVYVLFPTENKELEHRKVTVGRTDKIPAFIIIDGTWKEARKIFHKCDFLKSLPIVSLEPDFVSTYDLRRGAAEGNLCTIEAVIEILIMNGELIIAQGIEDYYHLFLKSYKAGVSGHKVKS